MVNLMTASLCGTTDLFGAGERAHCPSQPYTCAIIIISISHLTSLAHAGICTYLHPTPERSLLLLSNVAPP